MTAILDPKGAYTSGYLYNAFGNTSQRGDIGFYNEMEFTGSISDMSLGLYYMNARYYNPKTGRFITQDAMGGDAWTNNLYAYCGNNPVNFKDPTGYNFDYFGDGVGISDDDEDNVTKKPEEKKDSGNENGSDSVDPGHVQKYTPEEQSMIDALLGLAKLYCLNGYYKEANPFFLMAGDISSYHKEANGYDYYRTGGGSIPYIDIEYLVSEDLFKHGGQGTTEQEVVNNK